MVNALGLGSVHWRASQFYYERDRFLNIHPVAKDFKWDPFLQIVCFVDLNPCIICLKWSQLGAHCLLVHLFQLLYMLRATMCPSSGEFTVWIRHWYFSHCMCGCLVYDTDIFSLCMGVCLVWDQTDTHTEWKISVLHWYSKFSWWWVHSCPKHVEKLK